MYRILRKEEIATNIHLFEIEAPEVAKSARPGQFAIVRVDEKGERFPLTLADWDEQTGIVTLVMQTIGVSTEKMAELYIGDEIANLAGPLGIPSDIKLFGTVVCIAGGVGIAPINPIARALKNKGNEVITIMGARSEEFLFWEDNLRKSSDRLIITTDDGSYGHKARVTETLLELLKKQKIDLVIAIGPSIMMKFSSITTKPFGVKTIVNLNTIMVDGIGMCGSCRVSVAGETKFTCVDGPEFDGHEVDWDNFMSRQKTYIHEEKIALDARHSELSRVLLTEF